MTAVGALGAGTWLGIALYVGLAALALRWAVRLSDADADAPRRRAG
jgi:hypothetical protein